MATSLLLVSWDSFLTPGSAWIGLSATLIVQLEWM
jgi:hypothetical protein